ncbi:MAG TPA: PEP/pyruvate-binding domain-containing protein [Desulfosporosinus sp.]
MEKSGEMLFFSWIEAFQAGVKVVGGKGWNLGRLEQYGFNVPVGGVLAAGAYQDFMAANKLEETTEDISQSVTMGNIGEKEIENKLTLIREKIKAGRITLHIQEELFSRLKDIEILEKPLAIRSSATAEDSDKASFAGIHESFLNVRGMENILSSIKECYASLWTPQAIAYRRKMNISDGEMILAVVIMEMVEAEAAGVGFTCDPQTGREDLLLISANFGLGESVVSGAVDPDEYRLDSAFQIIQKRTGRKEGKTIAKITGGTEFVQSVGSQVGQVLSDENIHHLGLLIQRVFDALGCGEQEQPQDIEWVFDGKDFALVQARPVTVLPRYTFAELKNQPDIWSNANFKDSQPMVQSTLNRSLMKYLFVGIKDLIGYQVPPGVKSVKIYQGRFYWNMAYFQWYSFDCFGLAPSILNESAGGFQPEIEIMKKKPYRGIKGLRRLSRLLKIIFLGMRAKKNSSKIFAKVEGFTGTLLLVDFKTLGEKDLINKISGIRSTFVEYWPMFTLFVSGGDISPLVKGLERYFPGKGKAVANALMAGKGDITSAAHGYRLVEMAEIARGDTAARRFFSAEPFDPLLWDKELPEESPFKQSLRNFQTEYGHRGVYEMDIINPRWREDPSYLLNVVRSTMGTADLGKIKARQKEKSDEIMRKVNQRVPYYRRGLVNSLLKQALQGAELRETAKSVLIKIYDSERLMFEEIGQRLAGKGILFETADIYHCAWSEILSILEGDWDGRGLNIMVAERKALRNEMEALSPPDFMLDEVPNFAQPATRSPGNSLVGVGVATGRASGVARVINHPNEGERLQTGDVLVAPSTDPGWTPLFLRASAIVMQAGSSLSHGAIVAREYGIPAVVNIPGVMKMIEDGQQITVDGDEGKVYLT